MVLYYGRAKQRTGSVNRNQPGLKMSGVVSGIGRAGWLVNKMSKRVAGNIAVECVTGNRQLASQATGLQRKYVGSNPTPQCVTRSPGALLVPAAPRSRQAAGGVDRYYPLIWR